MKRVIALVLLACLFLGACAPTYEIPYNTETGETTVESTTEEVTVETTESEPEVLYRHPLTGEPLDAPFTGRATAVVINNIKACLPQYGLGSADIIYEVETEGGITRLLALFTDFTGVGNIGPVRSCRTYFNHLAATYDAPLVHCGGSVNGLKGYYDINSKLSGWQHLDQRFNGPYFFRDQDRKAAGYAKEHTLFTTGEKLTAGLEKKKFDMVYDEQMDYGFQFADQPELAGEAATQVTVKFTGNKTTSFVYEDGVYKASQYKKNHIDAATGDTLFYRNLIVITTKHWKEKEGKYSRSYYDLTGSGEGYFVCDGQIVPIKWKHSKATSDFEYTLADGTPITLGVGKTYVAVISRTKGEVTYQ